MSYVRGQLTAEKYVSKSLNTRSTRAEPCFSSVTSHMSGLYFQLMTSGSVSGDDFSVDFMARHVSVKLRLLQFRIHSFVRSEDAISVGVELLLYFEFDLLFVFVDVLIKATLRRNRRTFEFDVMPKKLILILILI